MNFNWSIILVAFLVLTSCFNPVSDDGDGIGQYRIVIRMESDNGSNVNINGYAYDSNDNFVSNATLSVDGQALVKQSGNNYYLYINTLWADGSVHTFSATTPDGVTSTGSIAKPNGSLTGFSVTPSSNTGVDTYTVTPPAGTWPAGSYIECTYEYGTTNYSIPRVPSGSADEVFTNAQLPTATSLYFYCAFRNSVSVANHDPDSIVTLTGPFTYW